MKSRACWYALVVGVVSMTSGCHCFREHFPHVGWRLNSGGLCAPCGPAACRPVFAPACSSPVTGIPVGHGPVLQPPMVVSGGGPDCPGCNSGLGGISGIHMPAGYPSMAYPGGGYPPIIGNPMPIPGIGVIPGHELHQPMPGGTSKN